MIIFNKPKFKIIFVLVLAVFITRSGIVVSQYERPTGNSLDLDLKEYNQSSSSTLDFDFESPFYTPRSQNWQWFSDDQNETPQYPLADENQTPSYLSSGETIKLRISIAEIGGATNGQNVKMRLEWATSSDFAQSYFVEEISDCLSTSTWCYADGGGEDNDLLSTTTLSDTEFVATHNESGISSSTYTHLADTSSEWEFTIQNNNTQEGQVYFFRTYYYEASSTGPVLTGTGKSYPSIIPGASQISFSVEGLPAGTTTENVTTNVATTPTGISFNTLPFNISQVAGQRFIVSTNAPKGYQVFVFQRDNLRSSVDNIIFPIEGTNEYPTSWSVSTSSAYGYHTGDDTLSDIGYGSSRFAADNSYAKFEDNPKEISYHPFPIDNFVFDLIFRVQTTEVQPPGDYQSEIVYIIVPVF